MGALNGAERRRMPLVAAVCRTPLLLLALDEAVGGVAELRRLPAGSGETAGLLRAVDPDAVVVDSEEEVAEALPYSLETTRPLVHISVRDSTVRVLVDGEWEQLDGGRPTPQRLRNVMLGRIATGSAAR